MNNELKITISGHSGSGKTTIAMLIASLLKNEGFTVEHKNEESNDFTHTQFNFNLNSIKNKKDYVIKINEVHTFSVHEYISTKDLDPECNDAVNKNFLV